MESKTVSGTTLSCDDIGIILKDMRSIDDKIIYQLNLATPTASFRTQLDPAQNCRELFSQLEKIYEDRNKLIANCMDHYKSSVRSLSEKSKAEAENLTMRRSLRAEQNKLRDLKNEITIEEIIRQRSLKVFQEKCKIFFNPTPVS